MIRSLLFLAFGFAACVSDQTPSQITTPPASDPTEANRPVDDVVTSAPASSDSVFVLENDPSDLKLVGVGVPERGRFGVPADGLARGIVTFETPSISGDLSVTYYTEDPSGVRDSARVVVRVE